MSQFDKDIQRAEQQLENLGKRVVAVLPGAVERGGWFAWKEIVTRIPWRTGDLKVSTRKRPGKKLKNGAQYVVYWTKFYAPLVEYGTRRARARPFLRPGAAASRNRVIQEIEQAVRGVSRSDYRGG